MFFSPFQRLIPDEGLQDERGGALLKLQLFVMQGLGVRSTLGRPLSQQHNAVIVPERQRTLAEKKASQTSKLRYWAIKCLPSPALPHLVTVLHELSQVEQCLSDLGDVLGGQCQLDAADELVLLVFAQFGPTGEERGVEEVSVGHRGESWHTVSKMYSLNHSGVCDGAGEVLERGGSKTLG